MIKRAGLVIGLTPDSLEVTVKKRIKSKLKMAILFEGHPLHSVLMDSEAHSLSD